MQLQWSHELVMLQLLDQNYVYSDQVYSFSMDYYNHTFNCLKNSQSNQVENYRINCKIMEQLLQVQRLVEQSTYKRCVSMDIEFITDSKSQVWIIDCPLLILMDPFLIKSNEPKSLGELLQLEAFWSAQKAKPPYMKHTKHYKESKQMNEYTQLNSQPTEQRLVFSNGQIRNKGSPLAAIKVN